MFLGVKAETLKFILVKKTGKTTTFGALEVVMEWRRETTGLI